MKRLGKLAAGFPSTLCVHVPYLLYVYQTITSAFGKLKSNGVRVRGKSRTKQSHQRQPSVLYANSPLFWFGRGDQPALSAQTRTHEMHTQKLFAAVLQLLAHERSLITKRMVVQLTEKKKHKVRSGQCGSPKAEKATNGHHQPSVGRAARRRKKLYTIGAKYPLWRLSRLQNLSRRYIDNYLHTKLLNSTPPYNEPRK
jgi:hypothetical protein